MLINCLQLENVDELRSLVDNKISEFNVEEEEPKRRKTRSRKAPVKKNNVPEKNHWL